MHNYDKIAIENKKKEKVWKSKTFLHEFQSKRWFMNGIHLGIIKIMRLVGTSS